VKEAVAREPKLTLARSTRTDLLPNDSDGLPLDAAIANEETFGPVVVVEVVDTPEEAIAAANRTMYGLTSRFSLAILTRHRDGAESSRRSSSKFTDSKRRDSRPWAATVATAAHGAHLVVYCGEFTLTIRRELSRHLECLVILPARSKT